jgi:hypothetical protein
MRRLGQIEATGSHREVGYAIGRRFAERIHQALDGYAFLQKQLLPYHHSEQGQAAYREFLELHWARYPNYLAELEGLAEGAGRSFEELFLVNLRGEYAGTLRQARTGCFDCVLVTGGTALIGHNEDAAPSFEGKTYLVRAQIRGKPGFAAVCYPGFLPGNAFGFNRAGVCFSVDNVRPKGVRVGIGRHFLARSLLEARSLRDAIDRITISGRASGFGYSIGSVPEGRVVYVETAPEAHHVVEVRGWYVHANHYRELATVEQIVAESSRSRVEKACALLRKNPAPDTASVRSILGDQGDEVYPIFRTARAPDALMTLHTALFDLEARQLEIYSGHPSRESGLDTELTLA